MDAPTFYEKMGLDPNQPIAIVVDAYNIGIFDILSKGQFKKADGTQFWPIIYYIFGPEVENDPAPKKQPSSKFFEKQNGNPGTNGVHFIPCIPDPKDHDCVHLYTWNPIVDDPLNKFFTKCTVMLSSLKTMPKGKIIEYSTNMTIKCEDNGKTFINESVDSKSKNDIDFLKKIINSIKSFFNGNDENEFQYAISFLKKISGDWLQVLLVLALKLKLRKFIKYSDRDSENPEDISSLITRAILITHDRIAAGFIINSKGEVMLTNHTPIAGMDSLNSAFLYSLTSANAIRKNTTECALTIARSENNYTIQIAELQEKIEDYCDKYTTHTHVPKLLIKTWLEGFIQKFSTNTVEQFPAKFNYYVREIFPMCLQISTTLRLLPFLGNIKDSKRVELIDLNAKLVGAKTTMNRNKAFKVINEDKLTDDNMDVVKDSKKLIELDDKIKYELNTLNSLIINAEKSLLTLQDNLKDAKKTAIYIAGKNWDWNDINVSLRRLQTLTNLSETIRFNFDRNAFLYEIGDIESDLKIQITTLFAKCYKFMELNKNKIQKFLGRSFDKFEKMTTSFIFEVIYNMGGYAKPFSEFKIENLDEICGKIDKADVDTVVTDAVLLSDVIEIKDIDTHQKDTFENIGVNIEFKDIEEKNDPEMSAENSEMSTKIDKFKKNELEEITEAISSETTLLAGKTAAAAAGAAGAAGAEKKPGRFFKVVNSVSNACKLFASKITIKTKTMHEEIKESVGSVGSISQRMFDIIRQNFTKRPERGGRFAGNLSENAQYVRNIGNEAGQKAGSARHRTQFGGAPFTITNDIQHPLVIVYSLNYALTKVPIVSETELAYFGVLDKIKDLLIEKMNNGDEDEKINSIIIGGYLLPEFIY